MHLIKKLFKELKNGTEILVGQAVSCPKCQDTYVAEISRSLGTRFKEHSRLKVPLTTIGEYNKNHSIKIDDVQVIAREEHSGNKKWDKP